MKQYHLVLDAEISIYRQIGNVLMRCDGAASPTALPDYLFDLIQKTELCLLCKHHIDIWLYMLSGQAGRSLFFQPAITGSHLTINVS